MTQAELPPPSPEEDDGPVAAVWSRFGARTWFRIGLAVLLDGLIGAVAALRALQEAPADDARQEA